MGVTDLWEVLSPVARKVELDELRGKKLAVDLSGWIVESERATQAVRNPVIRNLFFRCNKLLGYGIKLIFVLEGEAPEVKEGALSQRSQIRFGEGSKPAPSGGRSRRGLQALTSQCRELLDALGLPYVQSVGEAEGTCAYLDKKKMVDGCITQDGDAFLYGARTVYRKLCIEDSDPHVLEYKMSDIKEKRGLGLDREKLVALAVLSGCDYCRGVPNVGKETALKLLKKFGDGSCLERLRAWSLDPEYKRLQETLERPCKKPAHCGNCKHLGTLNSHNAHGCEACETETKCTEREISNCSCEWHKASEVKSEWKMELDIRRKALETYKEFPPRDVISEFMDDRDDIAGVDVSWQLPSLDKFESVMYAKLNWSRKESREKLFPLLTRWHLECSGGTCKELETLKPVMIVKERVRRNTDFYEVKWQANELWAEPSSPPNTLEPPGLFEGVYPDLVRSYHDQQLSQKRSKKKVAAADDGSNGDIREHFKVVASGKQRQQIKDEGKGENVKRPTKEETGTAPPEQVRPTRQSRTVVTRTRKPKTAPPTDTMATLDRYYKKSPRCTTKSSGSCADSSSEDFDVPLSERIARTASGGTSSTELRSRAEKTDPEGVTNLPKSRDVVESDSFSDEASMILVQEARGAERPEGEPASGISTSMPEPTETKALQTTEVFRADALDEASLILLREASAIGEKQPENKPASRTSTGSPEPMKTAASLPSDLMEKELTSPARGNHGTAHLKAFANTASPGDSPDHGAELAALEQSDMGGNVGADSVGCALSENSRKPSQPASFNLSLSDSLVKELMTSMEISDGQAGEDGVCTDGSREPDVGCTPPKRRSVSPGSSSKRTPERLARETSSRRSSGRRRLSFEPATSTPIATSATGFRNVEVKVERLTGDVVASVEMRAATAGSSRSDSCDHSKSLFSFEEDTQEPLRKSEMSVIVISDDDDDDR